MYIPFSFALTEDISERLLFHDDNKERESIGKLNSLNHQIK